MASLIVQKYGGTSVGTPERIQKVADRIVRTRELGYRLCVVVSAMGHTTDELIELAHRVSVEPPHREMDMLLTAGERISMALLSMALSDRGVPALSFTGSQSGIITTGSHRRARIQKILGDRVREALSENKVAIVAGFQGVSPSKEITTLGRGGSDTTAVALAAALGAERCEIYTDVDGIYSADPRLVPGARLWKTISHALMVELATRGAGVLHPRSVELAKQFRVPLWVLNSLNQNEGTAVIEKGMEDFTITGVTAAKDKQLIGVELARATVLGALWARVAAAHLSIVAPMFTGGNVQFFADRDGQMEWKKLLDQLCAEGYVARYQIHSNLVPVSVVGDRFSQDGAALGTVIETLARAKISVTIGSASALAMTVAVESTEVSDAVQALHQEFFG
ncbi:aspartate kinase [Bdellovibrionota bacterium FG-1]